MKEANKLVEEAEQNSNQISENLRTASNWFHNSEGTMFEYSEAIEHITELTDVSENIASSIVENLVMDIVDPIVQVPKQDSKYVGIIDFREFDGSYGYVDYNDIERQRKRVVCQQCVNEADYDSQVVHATEKSTDKSSATYQEEKSYGELRDLVHNHYERAHNQKPENVETGATLVSGTTIGSNIAISSGNESDLSFYDGTNITASIDATSVTTTELLGTLVNRTAGVTNLEGNVYTEPTGTDPSTILQNDGDIVFLYE